MTIEQEQSPTPAALGSDPLAWVFEEDRPETETETVLAAAAGQPDREETPRLRLVASQDIRAAASLWQAACALREAARIEVDGSGVDRIDTACLQILYALRQAIRVHGGEWVWHEPSPALCRAAACLGLTQSLELPA